MITIAIYSALLLLVIINEYNNSSRFWSWILPKEKVGHTKPPETNSTPNKAQFGSFYS